MILRPIAIALMAVSLAAPGGAAFAAGTPTPHRVRVLRSWDDYSKVGEKRIPRRVEIVYDYTDGVARQVTRDAAGAVLASRVVHGAVPSREEFAEAASLVRADPEIGIVVSRTRAVFEGGFLLTEPAGQPCGPHTRCIQIMLFSENRLGIVRRVVVDLVKQHITYPVYVPPFGVKGMK